MIEDLPEPLPTREEHALRLLEQIQKIELFAKKLEDIGLETNTIKIFSEPRELLISLYGLSDLGEVGDVVWDYLNDGSTGVKQAAGPELEIVDNAGLIAYIKRARQEAIPAMQTLAEAASDDFGDDK